MALELQIMKLGPPVFVRKSTGRGDRSVIFEACVVADARALP
jgi:hypothetical protein